MEGPPMVRPMNGYPIRGKRFIIAKYSARYELWLIENDSGGWAIFGFEHETIERKKMSRG